MHIRLKSIKIIFPLLLREVLFIFAAVKLQVHEKNTNGGFAKSVSENKG